MNNWWNRIPARNLIPAAFALATVAVAACGGGGSSGTVTPTTPCTSPVTLQVLYPQPGATGVPANTTTAIFVATSAAFPSNSSNDWDTQIVGPPTYGSQFTQSFTATTANSLPAGSAVPTITNPLYFSSALTNPLALGGATFSIYINNLNDANCYGAGSAASPISTFSTQ
ncbi:MAG TPA: hypothetical protein VMV73_00270 [Candidatus Dormibacteraeota bacterium]|nr:hypothetical protein [Candidatus Dormibacteraeota bacterium]